MSRNTTIQFEDDKYKHYDFNDDVIPLGATLWVSIVDQWFRQKAMQAV